MNPVVSGAALAPAVASGPRLLERFRQAAHARGDSHPTVDNLVAWARAFILFHNKRHPSDLGLPEVTHFLEHVVKTTAEPLPVPGAMLSRFVCKNHLPCNRTAKACRRCKVSMLSR